MVVEEEKKRGLGPMVNRSRVDIVAAILKAAQNEALKTQVMYSARISFRQLDEYLKFLLEHEMIRQLPDQGRYKITDAGKLFIDSYDTMLGILHQTKEKRHKRENGGATAAHSEAHVTMV